MAVLTRFGGRYVSIGLTDCIHTIVAALTAAGNTSVIESDSGPGLVRDMAVVTSCSGLHMAGRFAGGGDAVMTTFAGSGDD